MVPVLDNILAISSNNIDDILKVFHNYNKKLEFKIEVEHNNPIPFWDVIRQLGGEIFTNWQNKSNHSGRDY